MTMHWIDNHANALSALGSISSALVAVVASIIAAIALRYSRALLEENRILRLSGSDPEVVPYLTIDKHVSNLLNLTIANVGSGPAFDISFNVRIDDTTWKDNKIMLARNVGSTPFTMIPQGRKIESSFGLGFDLLSDPILRPFEISIRFTNIRGKVVNKTHMIDVKQFHRIGKASAERDLKMISDNLKEISLAIKNSNSD